RRKTKADVARENGLEPLAKIIMKQNERDVENAAFRFVKNEVKSTAEALEGARNIIAEWINENGVVRERARQHYARNAVITSKLVKGKEEEAQKYRDYFKYEQELHRVPAHRILALFRAENEGFIKTKVSANGVDDFKERLNRFFIKSNGQAAEQIELAADDACKRLLFPAMETESKTLAKEKADKSSIAVFAENLRNLLMEPPLGPKRILAIDPGFRTGCKVVCIDAKGDLLHNETIYPHPPQNELKRAMSKVRTLVNQFKIDAIAVGDGTAGRETENMLKKIVFERKVGAFMVNEDGASIYSASKVGRAEFPSYDVTVRGAVSIGRRLMDPLAELIKIDPKSLGIGQYQHDVDQKQLKETLDRVVESCVNAVGVNLNTASSHLLTYVSGLGEKLAQNIVDYRKENGAFGSRAELKKVPGLGAKAYELSAGFLRVPESENPLDNSAVHPERYKLVEKMAKKLRKQVDEILFQPDLENQLNLAEFEDEETGLLTLRDILSELAKPGRDPRAGIKRFEYDPRLKTIADVQEGMIVPGMVTNVTNFGAFVNIGIKENGLIHISNLANEFISNPADVVKLNQQLLVKVIEVDADRKRIQLSLKEV
ncbi:MAG: helix-hairpin-helix domain-containing protein, partial [Bacteroidetes bacterium]|nr:helix-hairpin-helix domain-containing protein [Bacteroidota bacterium]